MRFELLEGHRGEIGPIEKACGLMKASKSGFCEYLSRKKSNARIEREALEGFAVEAFERRRGRYGYRRIDRELRNSGIVVSEKRALRTMRKLGLAGKVAIDAIEQAVGREAPPDDGSLVFHDDQGARHASRSFRRCLGSHGVVQSVSRPGTPLDNAVAESLLKTLKRESAEERSYGTRDEAKQDIFKYIELYCDRARMHPALDCMSPVEYERQYA